MAGRSMVRRRARSRSGAERLFALLKDGSTWPDWTIFRGFRLERPGPVDPNGVGSVRVFSTRRTMTREEVVELRPNRLLAYRLLSGMAMRDYAATVELEPQPDGGTVITWTARFGPQPFGTAWFWRLVMGRVLARVAEDLANAPDAQ